MRKEYDLKQLKVKRCGVLPELEGATAENTKIRVTIALDKDVVDFFKAQANSRGALPYQTQINQALRTMLPDSREHSALYEKMKHDLLYDKHFVISLKKILKKAS